MELRPDGPESSVRLTSSMQQLTVALGWQSNLKLDLDASVLLLRKKKRTKIATSMATSQTTAARRTPSSGQLEESQDLEVADCVYFSNPRAAGVAHQGDRVRGGTTGGGSRTRSSYNRSVAEQLAEQVRPETVS